MPVLNRINRMFSFPMNNIEREKRNLVYNDSFAMEETDSGVTPWYGALPGSLNNNFHLIFLNKYGDHIYSIYNNTTHSYEYHVMISNGNDTYSEMNWGLSDQIVSNAINDGNTYVSYKSAVPIAILDDFLLYWGVYKWQTNEQQCKSILIIANKDTNIIQKILIAYDSHGNNFTYNEFINIRINEDKTRFVVTTRAYDVSFSSRDGYYVHMFSNINHDITYLNYVSTDRDYDGIGNVILINNNLLYDYPTEVEYETAQFAVGTEYQYVIINDDSFTCTKRYKTYYKNEDESKNDTIYNLELVNNNIKYLSYTYDWYRYWDFTSFAIHDNTTNFTNLISYREDKNIMERFVVEYNYNGKYMYYAVENMIYRANYGNPSVSTALFSYNRYTNGYWIFGLIRNANM